jgi:hypothetical protein
MNHAIWHLFVIAGSICHFIGVVNYFFQITPESHPEYYAAHWRIGLRDHLDVPILTDLLLYFTSD